MKHIKIIFLSILLLILSSCAKRDVNGVRVNERFVIIDIYEGKYMYMTVQSLSTNIIYNKISLMTRHSNNCIYIGQEIDLIYYVSGEYDNYKITFDRQYIEENYAHSNCN